MGGCCAQMDGMALEANTLQRKIELAEDVSYLKELITLRDGQLIVAKPKVGGSLRKSADPLQRTIIFEANKRI